MVPTRKVRKSFSNAMDDSNSHANESLTYSAHDDLRFWPWPQQTRGTGAKNQEDGLGEPYHQTIDHISNLGNGPLNGTHENHGLYSTIPNHSIHPALTTSTSSNFSLEQLGEHPNEPEGIPQPYRSHELPQGCSQPESSFGMAHMAHDEGSEDAEAEEDGGEDQEQDGQVEIDHECTPIPAQPRPLIAQPAL